MTASYNASKECKKLDKFFKIGEDDDDVDSGGEEE